jgi:hypothetical protein
VLDNENSNKDLDKEIQILLKLKHVNTINFYGFICENNKFGIVLEFC